MNNQQIMNSKPIIALLVKRTVLFFFAICALTFFLYVIGIRQGFMDMTQFRLLRLSIIFGLFLGVGAFYGIALNIWLVTRQKTLTYLIGIGMYALIGLLGFVVAAIAAFILVVAEGNGG
jgi:hypothetical protein